MSDPRFSSELLSLKKRLAAIFAVAAACILAGGLAYHHRYQKAIQKDAADLLSSTRHFKTEQILFWRADRITDTNSLLDSPVLSLFLNRLCAAPGDAQLRSQIAARLRNYLKHNRYRSALLAWPDGRILISAGEAPEKLHPEAKALIDKAAASGKVELGDFYQDHDGTPRLDLAARAASAPGGKKLFLVLEIAPEDYLYPLIAKWPTNSATGETTLYRQEGDQWLALNEFRLLPGAPLKKSAPLNDDLPAAKAFKGETGTVFGTDYRGKKVMASVGMVPGTGWAIIVKMDWQEVMADAGGVSALILLFTLFMFLGAAVLAYMLFRLQEARYSRSLVKAEAEKDKYKLSLQTLSDRANDIILLADPRERSLLMVNQKACEAYGYTEEEMLQLKLDSLIVPENISLLNSRLKALVKGENLIYETTHVKKGGERFPIEVSATGVTQEGRELIYFICRDIAVRKRLEDALKEKEHTLAGMMYNLPGIAYRCKNDPQWTMEFISQGCERLTGYKPAELLGTNAIPYNDLILPEDRDRVWREVQTALNADKSYQLIYRIRRKDGRRAVVWEQGSATKNKEGAIEYLEGLIIDSSEKAAAEDALRESQENYKHLFETMDEGFASHEIICDTAGRPVNYRFLEVNPAFERLTGLKRQDLLGRTVLDVMPGTELSWIEKYGKVALSGERIHFESYSNELKKWYAVSAFSPGKGRFVVAFFDITDRKLADEKQATAAKEWATTFDAIDDLVWVLDKEQRVVRANAASERVFKRKTEDIIGRHCWEIVHGTSAPIPGCPAALARENMRREVLEYPLGDKVFDVVVDPIPGKDGEFAGAVHIMRDVTHHKRMQDLLRESQVIFDKFMEHSPIYVFFKDKNIRAVRLSQNYESMLGKPIKELLGKSMDDLFPSDLAKSMVADDMKILHEGKQIEVYEEFNGHEYRTIKFPIEVDGKPHYLAGFTLDVTEQNKADRELRDSKARYKALFSQAVEGILVADLQTKKFLYCNPAICRLLGYTQEELTQLGVPDIHPKEDLPHVLAELEAQAKGKKTTTEVPCLRKDGTVFYASISTSGTKIDGRDCALGLFTDITERRVAEEALQESAEKLNITIDEAPVCVAMVGLDKRFISCNKAFSAFLGYSSEEISGRTIGDITFPEDAEIGMPDFRDIMAGKKKTAIVQKRYLRKDGKVVWGEVTLGLIRDSAGRPLYFLPIIQDITERKMSQLELAQTQDKLVKNLRLYTILAGINQTAAQIKDRDKLFERICDICVNSGGFRMAWIGSPDRDTGRVMPICSAGDTTRYLDSVRISAGEGRDSKGPTGEAAKSGKIRACQDIAIDPNMAPWREKALEAGHASSAAIPLYDNGSLTALLNLYSGQKNHFDNDELKMLSSIQAEINLAIEAISAEKKRALAQAALDRTSQHLADIMDVTPVILFRLSKMPPGVFSADWVSGNAEAITGYDPSEMMSPDWWMQNLHPDDKARIMGEQKELAFKKPLLQDFRFRKKDGTYLWIHSQLNISATGGEIIGSWTDVTYLKESEMHYKELLAKSQRGGHGKKSS